MICKPAEMKHWRSLQVDLVWCRLELLPLKVASRKRALKPFLGTTATEDAVASAFGNLIASGAVVIGFNGEATYPRFI